MRRDGAAPITHEVSARAARRDQRHRWAYPAVGAFTGVPAYLAPILLAADAYSGPHRPALVLLALGRALGTVGLVLGGGWAVTGALAAAGAAGTSSVLEARQLWRADPPAHDRGRRYSTGRRYF